jgi:two-component system LytT family sensor kinase
MCGTPAGRSDDGSDASPGVSTRYPSTAVVLTIASGIAAMIALTVTAHTYLSMLAHGHSFVRMLGWQLAIWMYWALAAPVAVRAGARMSASRVHGPQRWTSIVGLGIALAIGHAAFAAASTVWVQPFLPIQMPRFGQAFSDQLGPLFVIDLFAFAFIVLIGSALIVYDRARQLELRESKLESQLMRANLEALRLEIQPHFLFNTLNTIGALIRRQATQQALDMLVGLGDLMRDTLERRHGQVTTLESELDFVRKYVDLYRARFADRLTVTYAIDPKALRCSVPTFILQPLVENAFRHGVAQQMTPCSVEIGARLQDHQRMMLWVADDGVGVRPEFEVAEHAGTGLSNVRSRLDSLFGVEASLTVRPGGVRGTIASIALPARGPLTVERAAS